MKENRCLLVTVIFVLRIIAPAHASGWLSEDMTFFQDASYDGDFRMFAFKKNAAFQEAYLCETNMNVDLEFIGIKKTFFWMFRAELRAGCGDSREGMVLHPYDVSFGLTPTLEYRLERLHVSAGLDHRCFHYIDQSPPEPIVYWNKFVVILNSPHRRMHPYLGRYLEHESWTRFERLIWSVTWGYYISDFFGLVERQKLMTLSRPGYIHDFRIAARFALVKWRSGAAGLTAASMLGFKKGGEYYWAQEFGAEALFAMKHFDTSLFVNYNLDGGRFNSRDRLCEFGIRVIK